MPDVEFAPWQTPFADGALTILDAHYQSGKLILEYPAEGIEYRIPSECAPRDFALIVRLFHKETDSVYVLHFQNVGAFRLLDEHGLLELWQETEKQGGRPAQSTFKVRNHLWSKESEAAFHFHAKEGWSFIIATEWECVEVVCSEPPDIQRERTLERRRMP